MIFTIRIPTAQYAYLECEFTGEAEEAIAEHNRILELYNASQKSENTTGLNPKSWQRVLDTYLLENSISEDDYTGMSDRQRLLINEIKKSLARIKARDEEGTRADDIHRIIN